MIDPRFALVISIADIVVGRTASLPILCPSGQGISRRSLGIPTEAQPLHRTAAGDFIRQAAGAVNRSKGRIESGADGACRRQPNSIGPLHSLRGLRFHTTKYRNTLFGNLNRFRKYGVYRISKEKAIELGLYEYKEMFVASGYDGWSGCMSSTICRCPRREDRNS